MNWQTILTKLRERGLTQQDVAFYCGCSQASVSELAIGRVPEPKYKTGVALDKLSKLSDASLARVRARKLKHENSAPVL